jgi:acyl-CoA synthetase (AMP-forming)/AMP-acid ligase II
MTHRPRTGIVRCVFAVVLSGGSFTTSTIQDLTDPDPRNNSNFWNLVKMVPVTWYYGAPTFHKQLVELLPDAAAGAGAAPWPHARMVGNAAAACPPALAAKMRETFGARILPSYGSTECMPISSPPTSYNLEKTGTSGAPCGPAIKITRAAPTKCEGEVIQQVGHICVKGAPCFQGYETPSGLSTVDFDDGWFDTGDIGYLDGDGYLFITGRSKEIINRGGEVLSPLEIDAAVTEHPDVKQALSFGVKHSELGETVGLALVLVAQPATLQPANGDKVNLGFGRIVVLEIEAPNLLANLV